MSATAGPDVLVTGASSQIGCYLLPALLGAGYRVTAVSRHARPPWIADHPDLQWCAADLAAGCPVPVPARVVSAGPLSFAADWLASGAGDRRLVAFSSTSVLSKADSPDPPERRQIRALQQAEARLMALQPRALVLRPTLIYGAGLDRNLSRVAAWVRRIGTVPVARPANGLRQPVHAADLARLAVSQLESGVDGVWQLGGGSRLSYRAMIEAVFRACGRRPRLLSVDPSTAARWWWLLGRLPGSAGLSPEMLRRQNRDLLFDDTAARTRLGWAPREFSLDRVPLRPPIAPPQV